VRLLFAPKLCWTYYQKANLLAVLNADKDPKYSGVLAMWDVKSDGDDDPDPTTFVAPVSSYRALLTRNKLHLIEEYADFAGKPVVVIQQDERQQFLADPEIKQLCFPLHEGIKFEGGNIGYQCKCQKEGIDYSGFIIATKKTIEHSYVLTDSGVLEIDNKGVIPLRDTVAKTGTAASSRDDSSFGVVPCKASGVDGKTMYNLAETFALLSQYQDDEIKIAVETWAFRFGFMQGSQLQQKLEIDTFGPCLRLEMGSIAWAAALGWMWTHNSGTCYFVAFDANLKEQVQKLSISDVSVDDSNVVKFGLDNIRYFSVFRCHDMEVTVHDGDQFQITTSINGTAHMLRLLEDGLNKAQLDEILSFEFPMKVTQTPKPSQFNNVGQDVLTSSDAEVKQFHLLLAQSGMLGLQGGEALTHAAQKLLKRQGIDASAAPIDGADDTSTGALNPGAKVIIHSLTKSLGLNGQHAVVVQKIETSDGVRWEVQLTDGSKKSCKPENLLVGGAAGTGNGAAGEITNPFVEPVKKKAKVAVRPDCGTRITANDTGSFKVCTYEVLKTAFDSGLLNFRIDDKGNQVNIIDLKPEEEGQSPEEFYRRILSQIFPLSQTTGKVQNNKHIIEKLIRDKHIKLLAQVQQEPFSYEGDPCAACAKASKAGDEPRMAGGRISACVQFSLTHEHCDHLTQCWNSYFALVRSQTEIEMKRTTDEAAASKTTADEAGSGAGK
jgi:hypothetical protein